MSVSVCWRLCCTKLGLLLLLGGQSLGQTRGNRYFARVDGGNAVQCTGRVDARYPGVGTNQACAWDHPFRALPPGAKPRIRGGDTLIIAPGQYRMGLGGASGIGCDPDAAADCFMSSVPSGPDKAHPTRILGGSGCDRGCTHPPQLWGTEKTRRILNLQGSSHVLVAGLEITDHSGCVEFHGHGMGKSPLACKRSEAPYGPWAQVGVFAADSEDVTLRHLNIHGLSNAGVNAGRLRDWTLEDVRIVANGWAGWNGDLEDGTSANAGTLTFRRVRIEWNGCAETYPGGQPAGCWAQTAGGYGDGLGTESTGGNWVFENCTISHNTSDGLDLLYLNRGSPSVTIRSLRAEGNAGNQLKFIGPGTITNSVLVGNCNFFEKKPFTLHVDQCRAGGNVVEVYYRGTGREAVVFNNNTIVGESGLVFAKPMDETKPPYRCAGNESLVGSNNVFLGLPNHDKSGEAVFLFYQENCGSLRLKSNFSIAWNVRTHDDRDRVQPIFPSATNLFRDPGLVGPLTGPAFGLKPGRGSPLIDRGNPKTCPPTDFEGVRRPRDGNRDGVSRCDIGAYER